jgi:hypothetical protein
MSSGAFSPLGERKLCVENAKLNATAMTPPAFHIVMRAKSS